jgi:hypothetical protein
MDEQIQAQIFTVLYSIQNTTAAVSEAMNALTQAMSNLHHMIMFLTEPPEHEYDDFDDDDFIH